MRQSLRSWLYRLAMALLRRLPPVGESRYRLVVVKLDRLGDGVLSLGALRLLLREFGGSNSLLVVSTVAEPLFRKEFPGVRLLVMPPFCARFWPDFVTTMARHAPRLRSIRAEHLVFLRHQASDYLHALAGLIQARHVYASHWDRGWERACLPCPGAARVPYPDESSAGCLELEAHRRLVETVLSHPVKHEDILPVLGDAPPAAKAPALLVCPVAGDAIRQYPPARLAEALHQFVKATPGLRVTFCLPPDSRLDVWQQALISAGMDQPVEWRQPEDLDGLRQLIASSGLILAPDSAPAHLAVAMDKPGVFLLGGGHHGMFAPWWRSARQIWLTHPMDCFQCRWHCIHSESRCISHIAPEKVADALAQALASEGGSLRQRP